MASVELRPGDTLNIVWSSVQETPLGMQEVESSFAFSYEELLGRLKAKEKTSRRSGTEGARFSRIVALAANALKKGKWSTGAHIDRGVVFEKLIAKFHSLETAEFKNITSNALASLEKLMESPELDASQKSQLQKVLELLDENT